MNKTVINLSFKTIDAFEIKFNCYDSFDRPVKWYSVDSNEFNGIAQKIKLGPLESDTFTWSLVSHDLTSKIKNLKIMKIHFTDDITWTAK